MRIFKHGHACVRLETGGHAVVVDPGVFTALDAVDGATAILITHEHPDHWTAEHLAATDAPIYTIAAVAEQLRANAPAAFERVTVVAPGDRFAVGADGPWVTAVGEKHAVIHPELPHFDNSGYLLELDGTTVFHPGDALTTLPVAPDLLLLPVSAPWLKVSEAIDYARSIGAARSLAIHEAVYSTAGLGIVDAQLGRFLGEKGLEYVRLEAGQELS
ncbi:MAG: beta-lactamase [Marmoricola sp.]|nr:beta-lactamase [Marmoricola sp.]